MAVVRNAVITAGEYAYVKIKKSAEAAGSILLRCYKVSIEKKKDKVDVTQFPYKFANYIYLNRPEITLSFESYSENEYLAESLKDLETVALFDIEVYKDDDNVEVFENMIMTSYQDELATNEVEKFTIEFTKSA